MEKLKLNREKGREATKQDPVGLFLKQLEQNTKLADIKPSKTDLSYLSPEQRAESLWATFQNLKGLISGRKKGDETRFNLTVSILKKLYEDEETQAVYLKANQEHLQEIDSINGDYEKYQALDRQIKEARAAFDASAKNMFTKRGEGADEVDILIFETNQRQLEITRRQFEELISEKPELGALVEYETLRNYSAQLRKENFIWSPSRRKLLEEIEMAALSGKPILLSGESGTGKTRLVEQASLVLTGRINNETPGKDVRFQDLIAKPKISVDGATYYEYKEIGEAVTGKDTTLERQPQHDGRIVADDEFNLLPTTEQTERLARIATWTPGKRVRMPVTNEEVTIAPNFLYCAMVNLASERYDRKKIPPEVLRKFAKADVDYPEQTSSGPEIYEMMLAALMYENGRVRAAKEELEPFYEYREEARSVKKDGETAKRTVRVRELKNQKQEGTKTIPAGGFLWRLAGVINELNKSFSHRETVLKSKGEAQYLKDLVIDMGTVLGWLKEYSTLGRSGNLQNFMAEKLNSQFLSKAAYSADDRQLVREFLKYYSIDIAKPIKEKPKFEILKPLDIGLLSPRVVYEKIIEEEPILTEAYFITSEGERVEYYIKPYEEGEKKCMPGQIIQNIEDGKSYEFMGVTKSDGTPVLLPYKEKPKKSKPEILGLTVERAQEIMGADFLGPEAVNATFGFSPEAIPPIPFSVEDLERAKELNQFLILRVDKTADDKPLTMQEINTMLEKKIADEGKGKILYNTDWYKNEDFFTKDTPRLSWALVSKAEIPNSISKSFLQQTEQIIEYLTNIVFKDVDLDKIPKEYAEAVEEFNSKKAEIAALISINWQEAAKQLSELRINQLTRQLPVEAMYDGLMYLQNNNTRLMESKYTWTFRRASDGRLVLFGSADADGADVSDWTPDATHGDLGVAFSRSH